MKQPLPKHGKHQPDSLPMHDAQNWKTRLLKIGFWLMRQAIRFKYPTMMKFGRFIGRRVMQLDVEHSRIAAINIDTCFPMLSPQQNRELLHAHFDHVGMGIMEMAISWWLPDEQFKTLIHVKGLRHLETALNQGNGVIFSSAQNTTPEILSRCIAKMVPTTEVYHPHSNGYIDEMIRKHRGRLLETILMHEDLKAITDTLKQNHAVLFTHDAHPGHKQFVFAKFFDVDAATNTAVSRFARMTKAPVIPVTVARRENNDGYNLVFESSLPGFPGADIQTDTQRINLAIERWVDKDPAQYGWSYPRFRERPAGEPRFY